MLETNDDFKGGETEFLYKRREYNHHQYDCDMARQWTHQHKGNMVLEGYKYIATGWIHTM